ncbi:MAG: hypothetical protein ACJ8KA_00175 [Sulfurifustis sp.]
MVYAYYRRLTQQQKAVYRRSDEIAAIRVPDPAPVQLLTGALADALAQDNQPRVQALCQQVADALTHRLRVPGVSVVVLAVRPHDDRGELHGFYQPRPDNGPPIIVLWMRTAQRRRVVAFRTFLRTLLHELCHHFDYALLDLAHSFHTEGFYRRESSLFRQVVAAAGE